MVAPDVRILDGGAPASARTLVDVLHASVLAHPESSALEDERGALSYRELWAEVRAIAATLRAAGVGPGSRVGVRRRSGTRELYLGILGAIVAGAAYVPVDVDDPDERARLVFDTADVEAILGDEGLVVRRASTAVLREVERIRWRLADGRQRARARDRRHALAHPAAHGGHAVRGARRRRADPRRQLGTARAGAAGAHDAARAHGDRGPGRPAAARRRAAR
jgi:non-ribosomal peptide synthetase component F